MARGGIGHYQGDAPIGMLDRAGQQAGADRRVRGRVIRADARAAGLRRAPQGSLAGRPANAKNHVGALSHECAGLRRAPSRVGVGQAIGGRLIRPEHADAGPDVGGAVLEAGTIALVRGAEWTVDAGDDAGLGDHAGQRAGEICRLVLAEDQDGQVGPRRWRHDRVDEHEARSAIGPCDVNHRVGEQEGAGDHQVISSVALQQRAIVRGTPRDGDVGVSAGQAAHASPVRRGRAVLQLKVTSRRR